MKIHDWNIAALKRRILEDYGDTKLSRKLIDSIVYLYSESIIELVWKKGFPEIKKNFSNSAKDPSIEYNDIILNGDEHE